ncbi:flagellar motor switch protein FliM [Desulfofalx alkaliphila]|uniref:flagellar motor switch protein FliM n=1 Tax=Desulfofalx alkaliphila TaxID=105483 RepID=UPI0004E24E16|nr:flagellar motor switch protein FliM [Desulfofalx alkaliphila]
MGKDVLSQSEIDSLLQSIVSGEVTAEQIVEDSEQLKLKNYDFRRPNKFSKEHLRTFQVLHESFARLITNFFSGLLHSHIDIEVATVGQFTYEEFTRSVVTPTLLTVFKFDSHKGSAVLETSPHFIMPLIDLQLGGTGEMPAKVRDLTDIELSVARKLIDRILSQLGVIWKDIIPGEPSVTSMETNPHLHQLLSPSDIVMVITFSTIVGDENRGLLNLCLPYNFLEPVLSKFSVNHISQTYHEQEQEDVIAVEHWLRTSEVELRVMVGNGKITVKDFLGLQIGDVLTLDRQQGQDLDLFVQDQLKFKVQAGTIGQKLAVQVLSLTEEAWEFDK